MTSRLLCVRTLLAFLTGLLLPAVGFAQDVPVVTWQLVESHLSLHEPVLLRLTVQNTGIAEAKFDFGYSFWKGLAIRVMDADGNPAGVAVPGPSGLVETGVVRVESRAVYVRDFVVNNWFAFPRPGQYVIGVTMRNPILAGESAVEPPPESFHSLVVGELDEARLRRDCELLFSRISLPLTSAANVDDAWQAMGTLIQIHHPIAIEFLIRSIDVPNFAVASRALEPLANFGTPEALEALIEASRLGAKSSEIASSQLARVEAKIQDPTLRARARAAIQAWAASLK